MANFYWNGYHKSKKLFHPPVLSGGSTVRAVNKSGKCYRLSTFHLFGGLVLIKSPHTSTHIQSSGPSGDPLLYPPNHRHYCTLLPILWRAFMHPYACRWSSSFLQISIHKKPYVNDATLARFDTIQSQPHAPHSVHIHICGVILPSDKPFVYKLNSHHSPLSTLVSELFTILFRKQIVKDDVI